MTMRSLNVLIAVTISKLLGDGCLAVVGFQTGRSALKAPRRGLFLANQPPEQPAGQNDMEYRNAITNVLSNFMQESRPGVENPLDSIEWDAPKIAPRPDLDTLAQILDAELYEKEWFVTGLANPSYFSDDFKFQDPDVKVNGIQDYARGVYQLFDQQTSRAEIISSLVSGDSPNTITVTWRLSGKVNIGPFGLNIKPYICYTDLTVGRDGLITFQEDRFDIPGWDILLSSLFPFLTGILTAPEAPPVTPRPVPKMPAVAGK